MADPIQQVLQAFAQGELVVVTDDDDREGEGDLIVAASMCTAEKMAFIIRHTSGIVCAPITIEDARRLRLDPMVAHERIQSHHRFYGFHRLQARRRYRDFGGRARLMLPRVGQPECRCQRFRAPRACVSR